MRFALAQQRAVGGQAPRRYCALVARGLEGTARLGQMTTVPEAATADMRPELYEAEGKIFGLQMVQAKGLHARRVDDVAPGVEMVEPGVRGRMPTRTHPAR